MSEAIKHECGIALIHLKKDLAYFKEKYGTSMFAINKMYLICLLYTSDAADE